MSFLPTPDKLPIVLQPNDGKLLNILGDTVTFKITGEDTDGAYTVIQVASPPQGGPPDIEKVKEIAGRYEIEFILYSQEAD